MSWSYSGDPADSQIDACRFLIGDTIASDPIMQDEEIQYLIDTYGNNEYQVYYQLFTRAATLFARDTKRKLGPQSEDPSDRLKYYAEQAAAYKAKAANVGGISMTKPAGPQIFSIGMHNNPPWKKGGA